MTTAYVRITDHRGRLLHDAEFVVPDAAGDVSVAVTYVQKPAGQIVFSWLGPPPLRLPEPDDCDTPHVIDGCDESA